MPPLEVEIPPILFKSHVGHGFIFDAPSRICPSGKFGNFKYLLAFLPLL